ncbi:hypothetical protein KKC1_21660 [Calderihabitans maritimus]|uniref:Uncharacterized protein n=1 Tax=Calderihabitans maritimus TaxID=1246530 RepID=A0A1Z5HU25_9FIRM|nr:hypothetical protein KKC1_21660 [Calderihabitans maritimus]
MICHSKFRPRWSRSPDKKPKINPFHKSTKIKNAPSHPLNAMAHF